MTTPTDIDAQHAKTSLFEDLPEPSAAQLQQAQAQVTSKRAQGSPRLLQPNRLQIELRACRPPTAGMAYPCLTRNNATTARLANRSAGR